MDVKEKDKRVRAEQLQTSVSVELKEREKYGHGLVRVSVEVARGGTSINFDILVPEEKADNGDKVYREIFRMYLWTEGVYSLDRRIKERLNTQEQKDMYVRSIAKSYSILNTLYTKDELGLLVRYFLDDITFQENGNDFDIEFVSSEKTENGYFLNTLILRDDYNERQFRLMVKDEDKYESPLDYLSDILRQYKFVDGNIHEMVNFHKTLPGAERGIWLKTLPALADAVEVIIGEV